MSGYFKDNLIRDYLITILTDDDGITLSKAWPLYGTSYLTNNFGQTTADFVDITSAFAAAFKKTLDVLLNLKSDFQGNLETYETAKESLQEFILQKAFYTFRGCLYSLELKGINATKSNDLTLLTLLLYPKGFISDGILLKQIKDINWDFQAELLGYHILSFVNSPAGRRTREEKVKQFRDDTVYGFQQEAKKEIFEIALKRFYDNRLNIF